MTGPDFDRDASPDAIAESLEEHGYAIVHELADAATMARLNADFDPHVDAVQLGQTDFAGHKTKRINNLIAKSETCRELAIHPTLMGVCDRVLLPYCARYHLHVTLLVELQPGEAAQGLHRDGMIYPVRFPTIPMTVGTMWACTDFTAENGGTQVVPGSHRWAHEREAKPEEVINAVMPAGSVLIYTSNLIHGSGANRSNGVRRGVGLHYNLGWLRQEENQFLSIPPEKAGEIPHEVLKLIGYDFGGPYLGFVESGHPLTLADPSLPRDMDRTGGEATVARSNAIRPLRLGDMPEGTWD
ncbi:MAG: phytanoyl-CoA dioxygenase family protein [Minwuia sp.]|uniref:phytanoyl-CoA dioxygenase family protein n=1 Tax=Minwuia sp. TaxID=2493630 RepID=UPI003A890FAC